MNFKKAGIASTLGLTALIGGSTALNYSAWHNKTRTNEDETCLSKIDGPFSYVEVCKRKQPSMVLVTIGGMNYLTGSVKLYGGNEQSFDGGILTNSHCEALAEYGLCNFENNSLVFSEGTGPWIKDFNPNDPKQAENFQKILQESTEDYLKQLDRFKQFLSETE